MTTTFYIAMITTFTAYIIHKLGAFPLILDRFKIEDEKINEFPLDRKHLERAAANIKITEGYTGNIWNEAEKMTDDELKTIIDDFREYQIKTPTRKRLETEAAYIIERQGGNGATVAYMSTPMLSAIVRDYKGFTSD